MIIQGRETTDKDMAYVHEIISTHPSWGRTQISKELATLWNWRVANGQLKDIACRSFLLKLEKRGYITLPARKKSYRKTEKRPSPPYVPHKRIAIADELNTLSSVRIKVVKDKEQISLFKCLISLYHYLGFSGTVGENMKYLIFDKENNPLSCLLFGLSFLENSSPG